MKWVTAGVTFVNLSVVCGVLLGLAGRGLNTVSAALALVCGAAFAIAALLGTRDSAVQPKSGYWASNRTKATKTFRERKTRRMRFHPALMRYRNVWFWAVAILFRRLCFAIVCLAAVYRQQRTKDSVPK
jgi:hypothetical protein